MASQLTNDQANSLDAAFLASLGRQGARLAGLFSIATVINDVIAGGGGIPPLPDVLQTVGGAAGSNSVSLAASGVDTNISIALTPKGSGNINIPLGATLDLTGGLGAGFSYNAGISSITTAGNFVATVGFIQANTSLSAGNGNVVIHGELNPVSIVVQAANAGLKYASNVNDGASAVAHIADNLVALANAGAKLLSVRNNGVEKAYIDCHGTLSVDLGNASNGVILNGGRLSMNDGTNSAFIAGDGAGRVNISSAVSDGASAVGVIVNTGNAFANVASKLFSIQNNAVEKLAVGPDGSLLPVGVGTCGTGIYQWAAVYATNVNAGNSLTAGTNVVVSSGGSQITLQNGKFTTGSYSDSSGSPGAAVNNNVTGRAAVASGAQTCVITNSAVNTNSVVAVQLETATAGVDALIVSAHSSGSFTVTTMKSGAATNTTANATFSWVISN